MVWIKRVCFCFRNPHIRCSRFRLYVKFTVTALFFSFVMLFLDSWNSFTSSSEQPVIVSSKYKQSQRTNFNSRFMNIFLPKIQREVARRLNFGKHDRTAEPIPYDIVWDTSLTHTDRIIEQLHYIPEYRDSSRNMTILVWEKSGGEVILPGVTQFVEDDCLVSNCFIIMNPETSIHADAIITSLPASSLQELALSRREEDVWIYYDLEHPSLEYEPTARPEGGFNWTATYRHDSTLVAPYAKWVVFDNISNSGPFHRTAESLEKTVAKNYVNGKRKMAAALISNCAPQKRLSVVRALAQYIEVDIYGACGSSCEEDCFDVIKNYKFYLAFENANCADYITEKLFRNALLNDIIPVVFGASPPDYWRVAPTYSYIHVDNFPSVAHLAKYLDELDKNDDLYNAYFKWKDTGYSINTKFWCRLCALLNDLAKPRFVVHDLQRWLSKGMCASDAV